MNMNQKNLHAKKSLGQNFLCDKNIAHKIIDFAGALDGQTVVEIGPGKGILTEIILAKNPSKLISIEKDTRCVKLLKTRFSGNDKFEIIEGDALETDIRSLISKAQDLKLVSNLPYNIGTELLMGWLDYLHIFENLTLMFQKEVAERIVATHGTKKYGRLSVMVQCCADVYKLFDVPNTAFFPKPKVTSSVIQVTPKKSIYEAIERKTLEDVLIHAFGQRRKMLRSSLKPIISENELIKLGIDPTYRAENVSVEQFCELARGLNN